VLRPLVNLPARYAVAATLAFALGLTGCGRKSSLDPPPGGLAEPSVISSAPATATPGPDGQVAASAAATTPPGTSPAPKRRLPIDWLLD
jgi:hypothetical protein